MLVPLPESNKCLQQSKFMNFFDFVKISSRKNYCKIVKLMQNNFPKD